MRTPKFEVFLEEWERGIRVYSERPGEEEPEGLKELAYREADRVLTFKTAAHTYTWKSIASIRAISPRCASCSAA
jgi:hypothetical protein